MKHVETIVGFRWIWHTRDRAWWFEAMFEVEGFKETFRQLLFVDEDCNR